MINLFEDIFTEQRTFEKHFLTRKMSNSTFFVSYISSFKNFVEEERRNHFISIACVSYVHVLNVKLYVLRMMVSWKQKSM